MAKRYSRQPGNDRIEKWKAELAAHRKAQRRNRWKRQPAGYRPGMNVIQPPAPTKENGQQ
jgi:hypothetical protein